MRNADSIFGESVAHLWSYSIGSALASQCPTEEHVLGAAEMLAMSHLPKSRTLCTGSVLYPAWTHPHLQIQR
jgi:hypothetical protein